jgi:hypothetical protein
MPKLFFSECSPADGTNAVVNWQDYGMSRWQLCDQRYQFCRAIETRIGGWFWPFSATKVCTVPRNKMGTKP